MVACTAFTPLDDPRLPPILPLLLEMEVTPSSASETVTSEGEGGSCSTNATATSRGTSTSPSYGTSSRMLPLGPPPVLLSDPTPREASASIRRNVLCAFVRGAWRKENGRVCDGWFFVLFCQMRDAYSNDDDDDARH